MLGSTLEELWELTTVTQCTLFFVVVVVVVFVMLFPVNKSPSGMKQLFELCLLCNIFCLVHDECFNEN